MFDEPVGAAVPADAKADHRRRDDRVGMKRMRADFMDVTAEVDSGLPRRATVGRARNAPDMEIDQECRSLRGGRHRANAERWTNTLTVDHRRPRVPQVASCNRPEAGERIDLAIVIDAQDPRIVRPEIDRIADDDHGSEGHWAGSERAPRALASPTAKRVPIDRGEDTPILIRCEISHRATSKLLAARVALEHEEPVGSGGRKYAWHRHRSLPSSGRFDRMMSKFSCKGITQEFAAQPHTVQ